MATLKTPNIQPEQVESELEQVIKLADPLRAESLQKLQRLRSVKTKNQQRELMRLSVKLGDKHPRVMTLKAGIDTNNQLTRNLNAESVRAKIVNPQVEANNWLVHGRVLNTKLEPIRGLKTAVYDRSDSPIASVGSDITDRSGYFSLTIKDVARATLATSELKLKAAAETRAFISTNVTTNANAGTDNSKAVTAGFLYVLDTNGVILHRDKRPLAIGPGQTQYLEIVLDDAELDQVAATRYLGNSGTRELHDLNNQKPACKIDEIRVDHRINFKTQKEALALGYDYCAYCFGKDKSKR